MSKTSIMLFLLSKAVSVMFCSLMSFSRLGLRSAPTPATRPATRPALFLALLSPFWSVLFSSFTVAATATDFYPAERARFAQARAALGESDFKTFDSLINDLEDYPLYRYLVYERLRKEFSDSADKQAVRKLNEFEQDFQDEVLTARLTRLLQRNLVEAENWSLFLRLSKSRVASPMLCETARAKHETGQLKRFDDETLKLWIKPVKRPRLCAAALGQLESTAKPGIVALWDRIFASVAADRPKDVKALLGQLNTGDRARVHFWLKSIDSPERGLTSGKLAADDLLNRKIILDLVWRWSREDPAAAIAHWQSVRDDYLFFSDERYELSRKLALRGAYRRLPEAAEWLSSFSARDDDLELMEWRIRSALLAKDWIDVLDKIKALPVDERKEDHWAYWEARALEETGKSIDAREIYRELAELQSYYGFLSADHLGLVYNLYEQPIDVDPALLARLAIHPALIRAREYHHTGVSWEGRREWGQALEAFSPEEIRASAVLAAQWQMPDRAIISAGRAEEKRALAYRFPVLFEEQVLGAAKTTRIEPALIYGLMRRESGFVADIRSGAGAIGLMQLMPDTAKFVARLKGDKKWRGDLTDSSVNIDFGSFYLRHVLDRFDDHLLLALASYNAGPHRVDKWLPEHSDMPADLWVDTIPYTETRRYVRAVLAYSLIFEWRLTGETTPLSERMNDVVVPPLSF